MGAAETLACLASMDEEAETAIREAGGLEKLKELCSAASVAPAAVQQAARTSLAKMGAVSAHKYTSGSCFLSLDQGLSIVCVMPAR